MNRLVVTINYSRARHFREFANMRRKHVLISGCADLNHAANL